LASIKQPGSDALQLTLRKPDNAVGNEVGRLPPPTSLIAFCKAGEFTLLRIRGMIPADMLTAATRTRVNTTRAPELPLRCATTGT
jgi:hypothetical protein